MNIVTHCTYPNTKHDAMTSLNTQGPKNRPSIGTMDNSIDKQILDKNVSAVIGTMHRCDYSLTLNNH